MPQNPFLGGTLYRDPAYHTGLGEPASSGDGAVVVTVGAAGGGCRPESLLHDRTATVVTSAVMAAVSRLLITGWLLISHHQLFRTRSKPLGGGGRCRSTSSIPADG